MDLREYVLTYKVNNQIVANLFDYYEKFIRPLDKRFEPYSYGNGKLVLCFFKDHDDVNPSMGYVRHRKYKGVLSCHCFGCGRAADVVRLHQILNSQYKGIELSEKEACLEVAEMFDIPIEDDIEDGDYEGQYASNLRRIQILSNRYTCREFSEALMNQRLSGNVDMDAVGFECVKMISTVKKLYD